MFPRIDRVATLSAGGCLDPAAIASITDPCRVFLGNYLWILRLFAHLCHRNV